MADGKSEIRFDVPLSKLAVLDAYCNAKNVSRVSVMLDLLDKWSDDKTHEAIMICRVAGINPNSPESDRS